MRTRIVRRTGGLSLLACTLVLSLASRAAATVRETSSLVVGSDGLLNAPNNQVRTMTLAGGYTLGRIDLSGTLTAVNVNTAASDAQIFITAPNGATTVFHPFDGIGTFTTVSFSRPLYFPTVSDPSGDWTLRFYEVVDNSGVDATWHLTVNVTDEPATPPASTNLGTLATPGVSIPTFQVPGIGYAWYRLTLDRAVLPALGRYLDISMASPDSSPDSEVALFDAAGNLVASDDDSGPGLLSQLSFGAGTRPPIGDGSPFDGRNGALAAGTYYLAVGAYDLQYPASLPWGIVYQGSGGINVSFQVNTNLTTGTDCFVPTVTQEPQDALASIGQVIHFAAASTGTGTPSYHWRHLSIPLIDDGVVSGSTSPTLTIGGVRASDAGAYDVVITNACGNTTSNVANLGVTCSSDFNGDGDTGTDQDIEAFFACLAGNCCDICGTVDFNGDGDVGTDADIEAFFRVLAGGAC